MKKIEEAGAYYVSRFKVDVNVYESKESKKPLDLAKFLSKKTFHNVVDQIVFLGAERHPVRLMRYAFELGFELMLQVNKLFNFRPYAF